MKTLIELYDERPVENVLATEVFRPERTVFLCPEEIARNRALQEKMRLYFRHRGLSTELIFAESGLFDAKRVKAQLKKLTEQYPDCALDITGGTDSALFAGGLLCAETEIPVFTYSRKRNSFFDIHQAPFARDVSCTVQYSVEDCFMMAGGALRPGRVDNGILQGYRDQFAPFFRLYLAHRRDWNRIVTYFQQASQVPKGEPIPLSVDAPWEVTGAYGSRISAPEPVLRELEKMGFIRDLRADRGRSVRFTFRDAAVRGWLRDVGSVLELYVYQACLDTGAFHEVRTSAVVDWEGDGKQDNVTNEIDVMAMRGILPLFVSCKTCALTTEALNELAILRDRFGGQIARAAIVTAQYCRSITRHRARELDITVLDLSDLRAGSVGEVLSELTRTPQPKARETK